MESDVEAALLVAPGVAGVVIPEGVAVRVTP